MLAFELHPPRTRLGLKVIDGRAGRIIVEHEDGYPFTFQIHDVDGLVVDLEAEIWPISGAQPDAARLVAKAEAREQGWL